MKDKYRKDNYMLPKLHIKIERWKYNKTFEVYVSNMGNIKNRSKASLAPRISEGGYCSVRVGGSTKKWMLVHRLVMLTWRPTPEAENLTVDHLDHNKRNNSIWNLEWVSFEENQNRAKKDFICQQKQKKRNVVAVDITNNAGQTIRVFKNSDVCPLINKICRNQPIYILYSIANNIIIEIFNKTNGMEIKKSYGYCFKAVYEGEKK